jgi:hypothetical protein
MEANAMTNQNKTGQDKETLREELEFFSNAQTNSSGRQFRSPLVQS